MSMDSIVGRIVSDAQKEAEEIIAEAQKKAEEIVKNAELAAERNIAGTKAEVSAKVKSVSDGKAATARLDGAKAELREKRRVIDAVYSAALDKLNALDKKQAVSLAERLLEEYAEEGDEIVFSSGYKYVKEVIGLPVIKEKDLKYSQGGALSGGFVLKGKISDKDVSYKALLDLDRETSQAELAKKLFSAG